MNNKSKVQNPLTIIAIFAGIAEIAGTGVLLGLPLEIQRTFIWFVMLFPVGLVAAFFLVLLFKHNVLYAPSDFVDENNFMNLLQNKKVIEVVDLLEQTKEDDTNDQTKEKIDEALSKLDQISLYNDLLIKKKEYNNIILTKSDYDNFTKKYNIDNKELLSSLKTYDSTNEDVLENQVFQLLELLREGLTLSQLSSALPTANKRILKYHLEKWVTAGLLKKDDNERYSIN
ncbi:hypothetical protein [Paenibacillus sp. FSL K6-2393]|uniref:hypothetical protein n=1 Tax=Paenibacillus sp. FSL K6-2393 TaxID=2921475 RepID=UPI0030F4CBBD